MGEDHQRVLFPCGFHCFGELHILDCGRNSPEADDVIEGFLLVEAVQFYSIQPEQRKLTGVRLYIRSFAMICAEQKIISGTGIEVRQLNEILSPVGTRRVNVGVSFEPVAVAVAISESFYCLLP